jgi:hypothetical protein
MVIKDTTYFLLVQKLFILQPMSIVLFVMFYEILLNECNSTETIPHLAA